MFFVVSSLWYVTWQPTVCVLRIGLTLLSLWFVLLPDVFVQNCDMFAPIILLIL